VDPRANLVLAHAVSDISEIAQPLSNLEKDSAAVVVLPNPTLATMLQAVRIPAVSAVVAQDYADSRLLTYVSSKLVRGDIFGLAKVLPWGVHVHSVLVNTHEERTSALATTVAFARAMGVRGKYREAIELVVDELLMNALYNAPIGPEGPLFMNVAPKDRVGLRLERPTILQMACDGSRFAVSVRDSFGSLQTDTVVNYLERCLTSTEQIDRKTSGAGLGLYLVANNVTELIANLLPGTATEMICVFDVRAPGQQLKHLGLYQESFSRHAELKDRRPSHLVKASAVAQAQKISRLVPLTLATALVLLVVAGFLLVWPFLSKPPKGSLRVTVSPPGATVYINGVRRGKADPSVVVEELDVATPLEVAARLPGYEESQEVTTLTKGRLHELKLMLRQLKARVRVSSAPTGAQIWLDAKDTGLRTPTLLERLEPGRRYDIRLVKHGYHDSTGQFTPSAEETLLFHVNLPLAQGFAQLSIESKPTAARLFINDVDTGLTTPVKGHVLRSGQTYVASVRLPKHVPWEEKLQPKKGDHIKRQVTLVLGGTLSIRANVRARITVGNINRHQLPLKDAVLAPGNYRVHIRGDQPYLDYTFNVPVAAGARVNRVLQFGFVSVNKKKPIRIKIDQAKVTRAALPPGRQKVTLVDVKSGQTRVETVTVVAKKNLTIE
jgi:hypothetical protein